MSGITVTGALQHIFYDGNEYTLQFIEIITQKVSLLNNNQKQRIFRVLIRDDWINIIGKQYLTMNSNIKYIKFINFKPFNPSHMQIPNFIFIMDNNLNKNSSFWLVTSHHALIRSKGILYNNATKTLGHMNRYYFPQFLHHKQSKGTYYYTALNILKVDTLHLYGYVVHSGSIKQTNGGKNKYSKMIKIGDNTTMHNHEFILQIMMFGDDKAQFPNVMEGDIIRFHRIKIQKSQRNIANKEKFQGLIQFKRTDNYEGQFIVIKGDTIDELIQRNGDSNSNDNDSKINDNNIIFGKRVVSQKSSENFSWKMNIDPIIVTHLRRGYKAFMNKSNEVPIVNISDLKVTDRNVNLLVMIIGFYDENNVMYAVVWDGTMNKNILSYNYNINNDILRDIKNIDIIGSKVLIRVDTQSWDKDMLIRTEHFKIGRWIKLFNINIMYDKKYSKKFKKITNINLW